MEVWAALISLVGVAIGWGLTQASTWLSARQADKRMLNEVIYQLLELYRLLALLERFYTKLPELLEAFSDLPTNVQLPARYQGNVEQFMNELMHYAMPKLIEQQFSGLKDHYNAALLKLAAIDPISAHRLRGRDSIMHLVSQIITMMQEAGTTRLDEQVTLTAEHIAYFRQLTVPEAVNEDKQIVSDVLYRLAQRIDVDADDRQRLREIIMRTDAIAFDQVDLRHKINAYAARFVETQK